MNHTRSTNATILIVDDSVENLQLFSRILSSFGYRSLLANNGERGLETALANPPDLILLDIMMPKLTGYEVCERLKADERTRTVPIIFLTSMSEALDKVRAFNLGAVDYITKPFYVEEVMARVETHLNLRNLQRSSEEENRKLEQAISERQRLEEAERERVRQLEALHQASLALTAQLDLKTLLYSSVAKATELLGTNKGGMYLVRKDGKSLEFVVSYNLPKDFTGAVLAFGEGLSGRVAQTGEPLMVSHYSQWEGRVDPFAQVNLGRVLGVPIRLRNRVIGVLDVSDDKATSGFTENEVRLAGLFADQLAVAIDNARLYSDLERERRSSDDANRELMEAMKELAVLAATDKLTGAFNRRKFAEIAEHEIKRAERYKHPLTLIIFDIDHFKVVNDTYGHQTGDEVLSELTSIVKNNLRATDSLTRWGGEEFIVLAPGISLDQASLLAEKIRKNIDTHAFIENYHITLSLGVAQYHSVETIDNLVTRADNALLRAKRKGRNRVEKGEWGGK